MNINSFFSIACELQQEQNDSIHGTFTRQKATTQIDPDWQEPYDFTTQLIHKDADEFKSMMRFFTLPSLGIFVMKYLLPCLEQP